MKFESIIDNLGSITLPKWQGDQAYLYKHYVGDTLPPSINRWQEAIYTMLNKSGVKSGSVFITIDEKFVKQGIPQRRSGAHVDGFWSEQL